MALPNINKTTTSTASEQGIIDRVQQSLELIEKKADNSLKVWADLKTYGESFCSDVKAIDPNCSPTHASLFKLGLVGGNAFSGFFKGVAKYFTEETIPTAICDTVENLPRETLAAEENEGITLKINPDAPANKISDNKYPANK